jgi:hypothetical protein
MRLDWLIQAAKPNQPINHYLKLALFIIPTGDEALLVTLGRSLVYPRNLYLWELLESSNYNKMQRYDKRDEISPHSPTHH